MTIIWDKVSAGVESGRLMSDFPAWLVLWGAYTREFWAFPAFGVSPGTVLHDRDPGVLAGQMGQVQRTAAVRS